MSVGPVVLEVAGDEYIGTCRILAILWEGATTSGDTVQIHDNGDTPNSLLWTGRTDTTQTYLGINFGPTGLHAPNGFILSQISSGRVLVYLKEN